MMLCLPEHLDVFQSGNCLIESLLLFGLQVNTIKPSQCAQMNWLGLVRGAIALGLILKAPVEYEFIHCGRVSSLLNFFFQSITSINGFGACPHYNRRPWRSDAYFHPQNDTSR